MPDTTPDPIREDLLDGPDYGTLDPALGERHAAEQADPIRAACERVAKHIAESLDLSLDAAMGEESRYPGETSVFPEVLAMLESHMRGPLTDRERAAVEALRFYASEPNHRDARGTCGESDVFQDGGDRARAALRLYDAP